jgi:hypothetical protein
MDGMDVIIGLFGVPIIGIGIWGAITTGAPIFAVVTVLGIPLVAKPFATYYDNKNKV